MRIGIIGSGNIGGVLTRRLTALGHSVAVANSRGPTSLALLAQETGAQATTIEEVVKNRELVIVAVPLFRIPELDSGLLAEAPVVIDASNYYPRERDGLIAGIESGMTESAWVAHHLGRPVIKAFNTIIAEHLRDKGLPEGTPGRIALAVAGDDADDKAVAMELIEALGFDAVDSGSIQESWRQQPGTPGYLADLPVEGVRQALAAASPDRGPEWRATPDSPGTYTSPA